MKESYTILRIFTDSLYVYNVNSSTVGSRFGTPESPRFWILRFYIPDKLPGMLIELTHCESRALDHCQEWHTVKVL